MKNILSKGFFFLFRLVGKAEIDLKQVLFIFYIFFFRIFEWMGQVQFANSLDP